MFWISLIILILLSFVWTAWGMRKLMHEAQQSPGKKRGKKGSIVFLKDRTKHYTSGTKE